MGPRRHREDPLGPLPSEGQSSGSVSGGIDRRPRFEPDPAAGESEVHEPPCAGGYKERIQQPSLDVTPVVLHHTR
jgi:hypothetical protein